MKDQDIVISATGGVRDEFDAGLLVALVRT
jgi:hypothetical protein